MNIQLLTGSRHLSAVKVCPSAEQSTVRTKEGTSLQEELASNTIPTAFDSQVIDLLDPRFDFFDGLDSQQQSMMKTSNIIEINERASSQNGDDNVSLESSDSVIQKLLEFKKSK